MPLVHKSHPATFGSQLSSDFIPASGLEMINAMKRCHWMISKDGVLPFLSSYDLTGSRIRRCRVDVSNIQKININSLLFMKNNLIRLLDIFMTHYHDQVSSEPTHHWFLLKTDAFTLDQILLFSPHYTQVVTDKRQLIDLAPIKHAMKARMEYNPKPQPEYKTSIKRLVWDPDNEAEVNEAHTTFRILLASNRDVFAAMDHQDAWVRINKFHPQLGEFIFYGEKIRCKQETMPELPEIPEIPESVNDDLTLGFRFPKI